MEQVITYFTEWEYTEDVALSDLSVPKDESYITYNRYESPINRDIDTGSEFDGMFRSVAYVTGNPWTGEIVHTEKYVDFIGFRYSEPEKRLYYRVNKRKFDKMYIRLHGHKPRHEGRVYAD